MSRLDELIAELCPDGVEYKALEDVCSFQKGEPITVASLSPGRYPVVAGGKRPAFYCSKYNRTGEIITISSSGAYAGYINYWNEPILCTDSFSVNPKIDFNIKMLFYIMQSKQNNIFCMKKGGGVPHVYSKDIGKIKIPVPPLPVQEEIVRILDTFSELTAELTAELAKRKQQYQYYSQDLFSKYNNNFIALGNIAEIGTGSSNTNEEVDDGDYPFFVRSQEIRKKDTWEYDETAIITAGDGVGVGKIFHYIEGKYALHQRAYRIHIISKNVLPKYFFYYMKNTFLSYITQNAVHASVTSIRKRMLDNYLVPVPPLEEQERIVAILDRFDALCNDLTSGLPAEIEARKK